MLTHEAYLDALRTLPSTTAEWRSTLAGYCVLRLLDAWLEDEYQLVPKDAQAIHAVQEALSGVHDQDPIVPVIHELVQIVIESERPSVASVASPMLNYGRLLHYRNQWQLALDTFASVLSHAQAVHDELNSYRAASRVAFVLKRLGQFAGADAAYSLALVGARRLQRQELYYLTYSGFAISLAVQDKLKEAEIILNTIIAETDTLGLVEVHAQTLSELAVLAMLRADYAKGITLSQLSLKSVSRPAVRNRVLQNYGGALIGFGAHNAAKKILLPLLEHVEHETERERITINLLEIAAKEANKADFDRYRQELEQKSMLSESQVYYHLYLGKGYHMFNNAPAAIREWHHASELVVSHGLPQMSRIVTTETAALGYTFP